jgi:hypothetical protein
MISASRTHVRGVLQEGARLTYLKFGITYFANISSDFIASL